MFGRKKAKAEEPQQPDKQDARAENEDADTLMRQTLHTLDRSLAVKREAREKTQRFVGSLRPLMKTR